MGDSSLDGMQGGDIVLAQESPPHAPPWMGQSNHHNHPEMSPGPPGLPTGIPTLALQMQPHFSSPCGPPGSSAQAPSIIQNLEFQEEKKNSWLCHFAFL